MQIKRLWHVYCSYYHTPLTFLGIFAIVISSFWLADKLRKTPGTLVPR
jgi:hypothetical protein